MKISVKQLVVAFFGALLFPLHGHAQEEAMFSGESSVVVEPPPIAGAWAGSAAAVALMEDGSDIPRRRSPWGTSWFNWANVNMKNYRDGAGRLETYNYLSFDYRLNWESKISIRPEFYVSGAGRNFFGDEVSGETEMGDIYLQYTHNQWGLLPTPVGDVGVSGSARVYYPNSESAKRQRQLTRLQGRMIMQMPLAGGFWLAYHLRPTYFVQTRRAYMNEFFIPKTTEHYRLEQRLEVMRPLANRFAFHQEFSVEHRKYYGSETNSINERVDGFVGMSTAVSWLLGSVSFKGGLNYKSKIARPDRNSQIYNEAETAYFLMTNVRL